MYEQTETTETVTKQALCQHSVTATVSTKGVVSGEVKCYVSTPAEMELAVQTLAHVLRTMAETFPTFALAPSLEAREG